MDPQQRKMLEVTYECFESAGVTLDELSGSQTATYVGCFNADIKDLQGRDTEYGIPYQNTVRRQQNDTAYLDYAYTASRAEV